MFALLYRFTSCLSSAHSLALFRRKQRALLFHTMMSYCCWGCPEFSALWCSISYFLLYPSIATNHDNSRKLRMRRGLLSVVGPSAASNSLGLAFEACKLAKFAAEDRIFDGRSFVHWLILGCRATADLSCDDTQSLPSSRTPNATSRLYPSCQVLFSKQF